jgi:predicted dehydrogenase
VRPRLDGRRVLPRLAEPMEWLRSAVRGGYLVQKRRSPWHEPSYARALAAFLTAVAGGAACHPDATDGSRVTELVAAASASAVSGRPIGVGTVESVSA